jgi:hypothetical protein
MRPGAEGGRRGGCGLPDAGSGAPQLKKDDLMPNGYGSEKPGKFYCKSTARPV